MPKGQQITKSVNSEFSHLDIPLERDGFLRQLLKHLAGTLQEVIGLEEASGFVSIVGQKMGDEINESYRKELNVSQLNREQVVSTLVDLKQRIQGNFRLVSEDEKLLVLETTSCPFEDKVSGRPSLCMMTSNVFGTITAENLGYAKVSLEKTIANGDAGCRVAVYLSDDEVSRSAEGNEYYRS